MQPRAFDWLTPHQWAPVGANVRGLPGSSGNRVLGVTVHLPEHSLPRMPFLGLWGTECSGGYCSPPQALSPERTCTDPRGTECSGEAARNPEHSLPELPSVGPRDTCVPRGPPLAAPGTFLPVLSFLDRRGTRVLGGHRIPSRALSSRHLDFVDHRGTWVFGDHRLWPVPSSATWSGLAGCSGSTP